MAILRYFIYFLPLLLATACNEEFDPGIDTRPVLCLNSLITPGEPVEVQVTHTWVYNDEKSEKDHSVSDATVTVFANGVAVGADYLPGQGDRIRIVAESPAYGNASAEVTVPFSTPVGDVRVSPSVTDTGYYEYDSVHYVTFDLNIEMDINDPGAADNFYRFGCESFSPVFTDYLSGMENHMLSLGEFQYDMEPVFKEHVGMFETVMGDYEDTRFVFFTDRQFSGKTYTLHLNFSDCQYRVKSPEYDESFLDCGVDLYLFTVSRSFYNWAVYKWHVDDGILGDFSDIGLAEQKWGYSNVSTGAGVVAAQSTSRFTVCLKSFLQSVLPDN